MIKLLSTTALHLKIILHEFILTKQYVRDYINLILNYLALNFNILFSSYFEWLNDTKNNYKRNSKSITNIYVDKLKIFLCCSNLFIFALFEYYRDKLTVIRISLISILLMKYLCVIIIYIQLYSCIIIELMEDWYRYNLYYHYRLNSCWYKDFTSRTKKSIRQLF